MASTLFRINPETGLLSVAQPFKTDTQESYVIRVRAYRQTDAAIFATVIVRVVITRNTNAPRFLHNDLVFNVAENYPLGVSLGRLNATDKDTVSTWLHIHHLLYGICLIRNLIHYINFILNIRKKYRKKLLILVI